MAQMLITEALQQVKIVTDRIQKKQVVVNTYIAHNSRFADPLAKQGGSAVIVAGEMQAIASLSANLINIRTAIAKKNQEVSVTVGGLTMTVAEWIIWKRDVAPLLVSFTSALSRSIVSKRAALESEQSKVAASNTPEAVSIKEANLVVNLDEKKLATDAENLAVTLGTLDGKLSVVNATTSIEIAD